MTHVTERLQREPECLAHLLGEPDRHALLRAGVDELLAPDELERGLLAAGHHALDSRSRRERRAVVLEHLYIVPWDLSDLDAFDEYH